MELYVLKEFYYFSKRNKRYFTTAVFFYLYSFKSIRKAHHLRIGFALLQHIDDVLDGDRKINGDPREYVDGLIKSFDHEIKEKKLSGINHLASYFGLLLEGKGNPKLVFEFRALIEVLKFDFVRRIDKLILSELELEKIHSSTFYNSVDIALALSGSKHSAAEELELVTALCWCSPMRDIEDDFKAGLINIPSEIIDQASISQQVLFESDAFKNWRLVKLKMVKIEFDGFKKRNDSDFLCRAFMQAIQKFATKYELEQIK